MSNTTHQQIVNINVPTDWNTINPILNTDAASLLNSKEFSFGPLQLPFGTKFGGYPVNVELLYFQLKPIALDCVINPSGKSIPISSVNLSLNFGGSQSNSENTLYSGNLKQQSQYPQLFGGNVRNNSTGGFSNIPIIYSFYQKLDFSGVKTENRMTYGMCPMHLGVVDGNFSVVDGKVNVLVTDPEENGAIPKNSTHKLYPFIKSDAGNGANEVACLTMDLRFTWREGHKVVNEYGPEGTHSVNNVYHYLNQFA